MHIVVGSINPVKIQAVKRVVTAIWSEAEVYGVAAESGVSLQPMTDEETMHGSMNRAKNALDSSLQLEKNQKKSKVQVKNQELTAKNQVLAIGLEGGVFETSTGEMWNTVWISIVDDQGRTVSVNGSRFIIPKDIADGIRAGKEMGLVMDELLGQEHTNHKEGFIGYMTTNIVDREGEYSNLVRLAVGIYCGKR